MTESVETFLTDWARAEQAGDADTLDTLLASDFTAVGPLGFVLPKPAWLARHRDGDLRYQSFTVDEATVRRLGPVALVTATNHQQATYQGHPIPAVLRVTLVLAATDPGWQLAAAHLSFVAGTPGAPPIPGPPAAAGRENEESAS